jgi:hypothetical protein
MDKMGDYEKYILDFARLAQSEKWNCFVLGRNSVMPLQNVLSIGHNWLWKSENMEKLTYAANWDDFDKVHLEGTWLHWNAYFPLSDAATQKWKSSIKLGSSTLQNGQTKPR